MILLKKRGEYMPIKHTMPMAITDKKEGIATPQFSSGSNALVVSLLDKVRKISAPIVLCTTPSKGSLR